MGSGELSRRDWLLLWRRPQPPAQPPAPPAPVPSPPMLPSPPPLLVLPPLRPPGALDEPDFLDRCRRCGACAAACPVAAIRPREDGTPAIDARAQPCVVCTGLACTRACPTGALTPLDDAAAIRMGTASVDITWCLAHRGRPCRACVDTCPVPGAIGVARGEKVYVPVVDTTRCVGCGVCEKECPTRPAAIRIIPRAAPPNRRECA